MLTLKVLQLIFGLRINLCKSSNYALNLDSDALGNLASLVAFLIPGFPIQMSGFHWSGGYLFQIR